MNIVPNTRPVALVTGAARRIGRTIALDLVSHGWAIAIHCNRSMKEAAGLASEIEALGGQAAVVAGDLTREEEVRLVLPRAEEVLGAVTLLVNNASLFLEDDIAGPERGIWDLHMEANLRAPAVLAHDLAKRLPPEAEGNVINILDQRVINLTPHFMSYTLSKSALWTLTRTLAMALAPRIRVNGIGPGPTMRGERQTEDQFRAQWEALPLGRPTDPSEIASAVRFILASRSMTGQMIALDGGEHLGWAQPGMGFVPHE